MSIPRYKQSEISTIIFYVLETIMLVGLAYLAYKAFVNREILNILICAVVAIVNFLIVLVKRQCVLAINKQEEIFQNIIHDFKTPIHSILGFTELSKLKLKQVEESKDNSIKHNNDILEGVSKNIDIITKEGIRLIHLSNQILNLSQLNVDKRKTNWEKFTAGNLMSETLPLLESLCDNKKLSFKLDINDEEVLLFGDKEKLMQVIYNLISNAVKFTDNGHVNFGCLKKDSNMCFYIEDTGRGILSDKDKVFERFYTSSSDPKCRGNGIGLAICKDIINIHYGQIWFESNLDKGTTFYFNIPIK